MIPPSASAIAITSFHSDQADSTNTQNTIYENLFNNRALSPADAILHREAAVISEPTERGNENVIFVIAHNRAFEGFGEQRIFKFNSALRGLEQSLCFGQ